MGMNVVVILMKSDLFLVFKLFFDCLILVWNKFLGGKLVFFIV